MSFEQTMNDIDFSIIVPVRKKCVCFDKSKANTAVVKWKDLYKVKDLLEGAREEFLLECTIDDWQDKHFTLWCGLGEVCWSLGNPSGGNSLEYLRLILQRVERFL